MPDDDGNRWPWESDEDFQQPPTSSSQRLLSTQQSSFQHRSGQQPHEQQHQQQQRQQSTETFVQEMLAAHNRYRAMHQVPPLTLDKNLTRGAQEWAEELANHETLAPNTDCKLEHIGESLAMKYNSQRTDFTGGEFTDHWYSGIADYDFANDSPRLQRGSTVLSFTQMVWKNSILVGFGRAVSPRGKVFVVARYNPGGNEIESFATNVLPPQTYAGSMPGAVLPPQTYAGSMPGAVLPTQTYAGSMPGAVLPPQTYAGSMPGAVLPQASNGRWMGGMQSSDARLNEHSRPVIGPMRPTDTLVSTSKSTSFESGKTTVTVEEKYMTQDGGTYTRQRKSTFIGERRDNG